MPPFPDRYSSQSNEIGRRNKLRIERIHVVLRDAGGRSLDLLQQLPVIHRRSRTWNFEKSSDAITCRSSASGTITRLRTSPHAIRSSLWNSSSTTACSGSICSAMRRSPSVISSVTKPRTKDQRKVRSASTESALKVSTIGWKVSGSRTAADLSRSSNSDSGSGGQIPFVSTLSRKEKGQSRIFSWSLRSNSLGEGEETKPLGDCVVDVAENAVHHVHREGAGAV